MRQILSLFIRNVDYYAHNATFSPGEKYSKHRFFRKLSVYSLLFSFLTYVISARDVREGDIHEIEIIAGKNKGFQNCSLAYHKLAFEGKYHKSNQFLWNHTDRKGINNTSLVWYPLISLECKQKRHHSNENNSDAWFSHTYLKIDLDEELPIFYNSSPQEGTEEDSIDAIINRILLLKTSLDKEQEEKIMKRNEWEKNSREKEVDERRIYGLFIDLDFDRIKFPFDPNNDSKFRTKNTMKLISSLKIIAKKLENYSLDLIIASVRGNEDPELEGNIRTVTDSAEKISEIEGLSHSIPHAYDRDYLAYKIDNMLKEGTKMTEKSSSSKVHNTAKIRMKNISLLIIPSSMKILLFGSVIMKYYYDERSLLSFPAQQGIVNGILDRRLENPCSKVLVFGLGYDSPVFYHASGGEIIFVESNQSYIDMAITHVSVERRIPEDNIYFYPFDNINVASSVKYLNEIYSMNGHGDLFSCHNKHDIECESCFTSFTSCINAAPAFEVFKKGNYFHKNYDLAILSHKNLQDTLKASNISSSFDRHFHMNVNELPSMGEDSSKEQSLEILPNHIQNRILNFDAKYPVPRYLADRGPFDIILIDGPEGNHPTAPGRLLPIHWSVKYLSRSMRSSWILIDDAQRELEFKAFNLYAPISSERWREIEQVNLKQKSFPIQKSLLVSL